ncbi:alkene reductase [Sphingoaurantiacus capsulatus]|uniref:Alkene reductase n=1 Tax=Sphingoaurantiacus capsulatus TaxID=1771310 RepID=A0ABV7XCW3_9SPHN
MPTLFDPIRLGATQAANRIMMAPLTRGRADAEGVPLAPKIDYYRQRAGAGLIITEATGISRQGLGWVDAPGIWSDAQVEAWKPVTDAVHADGGRIFLQLWHMGRLVHSDFLDGEAPVSSSDRQAPGNVRTYKSGGQRIDYSVPRPLSVEEIKGVVADYAHAAKNAIRAGFDGVQIHGANGYLIDQFLRDNTNFRTDEYGGSIENRLRFMTEVVDAVVAAIGAERTSIRFSPNGETQGVEDSDPVTLFTAAAQVIESRGLAFLELREQRPDGTFGRSDVPAVSPHIRKVYNGPLALNGDYTRQEALDVVLTGRADAVAFGRPFIANPDLVERLRDDLPLAESNIKTWYSPGPEGYSDYPRHDAAKAA